MIRDTLAPGEPAPVRRRYGAGTAPVRRRYGPATAPVRRRYGGRIRCVSAPSTTPSAMRHPLSHPPETCLNFPAVQLAHMSEEAADGGAHHAAY
eukprot:gene56653-biopygen94774